MPASPSWQTWRLAFLPTAESVLGRSTTHPALRRPFQIRIHGPGNLHNARSMASEAIPPDDEQEYVYKDIKVRKEEIDQSKIEPYPRYTKHRAIHKSMFVFHKQFRTLKPGQYVRLNGEHQKPKGSKIGEGGVEQELEVAGRIHSIRKSGTKLVFLDIREDQEKLQVILVFRRFNEKGIEETDFKDCIHLLRRGDVISVQGVPHRTSGGELSIEATELPRLLAPCLHQFPVDKHGRNPLPESETTQLDRHVEMLSKKDQLQTIILRAEIIKQMRFFFLMRNFFEVETPILAAVAGGAVARPFETSATEFPDRKLSLRIAPELWLKRLIIGGMSRVFEIGPCFRNEGLDKTHNPEFTSCEFYQAWATLPQLLTTTESLLTKIAMDLSETPTDRLRPFFDLQKPLTTLPFPIASFKGPYPKMDFIPSLNAVLNLQLPNLASPTARNDLLAIFTQKDIAIPPNPTLPRLLDKLSATFLEPECIEPTWITFIPECVSPLSKSIIHPTAPNSQPVAARAELFINGRELVNCYEEENSPFEQRRKFKMQQVYARAADPEGAQTESTETMKLDEDYLRALEWGLPPTGGWGCGVDRLVMLFTGKDRIGDVLSFGNLRRVTRGAEKRERERVLPAVNESARGDGKVVAALVNTVDGTADERAPVETTATK